MKRILSTHPNLNSILLVFVIGFSLLTGTARLSAADSVSDKVSSAAATAEKSLQDVGHRAKNGWQDLWQRIDEKRLTNRTPDQLVAWAIMGLLVGGLIHSFSKLKRVSTLLFGLVGAFIGGILANVTQLNLGMGPVLISYEELLASFVGGLLIVFIARWFTSRRPQSKSK